MDNSAAIKFYSYFRSSAAYRVRIALALKELPVNLIPVNLAKGEHGEEGYLMLNPQGLVPALEDNDLILTQSLAMIEYLDECYDGYRLLPDDVLEKAQVRGLAQQIAMDIHPLNNLRVLKFLQHQFNISETQKSHWYQHWIAEGFTALEKTLANYDCQGRVCWGAAVSLADVCLIPQVYNAQRFKCDLKPYPLILSIAEHCNQLPAFISASPQAQIDFSS